MKRLAVSALLAFPLAACFGGEAKMTRPKGATSSGVSTAASDRGCDESMPLWLLSLEEPRRLELERALEGGVLMVRMTKCGDPHPVPDCRLVGDYRVISDEMTNELDKVRTEAKAAHYAGGKEIFARGSGFDVATRGTTFLVDGSSVSGEPTGPGCGSVTHVATKLALGTFRLAPAGGGAEFPEGATADTDKEVHKGGDPAACKKEGVRSSECRALLAVELRVLRQRGRAASAPGEHEQTGIIAPH